MAAEKATMPTKVPREKLIKYKKRCTLELMVSADKSTRAEVPAAPCIAPINSGLHFCLLNCFGDAVGDTNK